MIRQVVLGFSRCDAGRECARPHQPTSNKKELVLQPVRDFRPRGFIVWSPGPTSVVRRILIGLEDQLAGPIIGHAFSATASFEELEEFARRGELGAHMSSLRRWSVALPVCRLGHVISVAMVGTYVDAAVWGEWIVE